MRCFIDTNILISAALFPDSVPAKAFFKAVSVPHTALVSDYCLTEMRNVYVRKFPHKLQDLEQFLDLITDVIEIVTTPTEPVANSVEAEQSIRDINDRPIYRAAIAAKANLIITGDKDLLDAGITHPNILTAAEFLSE